MPKSGGSSEVLYRCPITQEVMENPVTLIGDGHTYEEDALKIWLEDNNRSPLTGATLTTKEYCVNFALKNLISEFRKTRASDKLKTAQRTRFENNFLTAPNTEESPLDCTIIVGDDKRVFGVVRGMIGVMSPYFRELLLSDQKEDTFEIEDVSGAGFEQIVRVAYHLEPQITTENVMETLTASHSCGVTRLKNECLAHLAMNLRDEAMVEKVRIALEPDNDYGIDEELRDVLIGLLLNRPLSGDNVMSVFNSALSLKMLTRSLEKKCCRVFTSQAEELVNSESFMATRPELLTELVKSDFFHVNEEVLWKRVLDWCKHQVQMDKAKGRGDGATEEKQGGDEEAANGDADAGGDGDGGANADAGAAATEEKEEAVAVESKEEEDVVFRQESEVGGALGIEVLSEAERIKLRLASKKVAFPSAAMPYLEPLIEYFRFGLMNVSFFAEKVSPLVPRTLSENVLVYKLMPEVDVMFNSGPRLDPLGATGLSFAVPHAFRNINSAKQIPDPNVEAQWSRVKWGEGGGPQWFTADCSNPVTVNRFELKNFYDDNDTVSQMELYRLPLEVEYNEAVATSMDAWESLGQYPIAKSKQWQTLTVDHSPDQKARYFKWVVTAIHGEDNNYTCISTLKMHVTREQWSTNFANKLE